MIARDGGCRFYLNDSLTQNTYDPDRKLSVSHFTYALSGLARAYTTNINDVLCIGLGVGIVPMEFARQGARVDVVEINPAVVPVAVRFFDLQTNKLNLTLDDGRHFLNRCRKQYDAVVLDAFLGDSSPSHLMTREAFASIRRVLRPGGTLVINSFGNLEDGTRLLRRLPEQDLEGRLPGACGCTPAGTAASSSPPRIVRLLTFVAPAGPGERPSGSPARHRSHLRRRRGHRSPTMAAC